MYAALTISGVIFSLVGAALGLWAVRSDLPELADQVAIVFEAVGLWLAGYRRSLGTILGLAAAVALFIRLRRPVAGFLRRQTLTLLGFQRDQVAARRDHRRYGIECRCHRHLLGLSLRALADSSGIPCWRLICFRLFPRLVPAHKYLRALAAALLIKKAHFRTELGRQYGAERARQRLLRYRELGVVVHTKAQIAGFSPQKVTALVARAEKQRWQDLLDEGKVQS